ncbi:aminotransferase-like domain-containing protein [Pararcticibacter amylolyticus]|uniref:GntR family transcriptional regulator n=1 Tax=Pararcticibacter amylolyticus TaxID=2173175 RepID=A0A2U2PKZ1_9SPHI|nr:PLP-dependent aminotransferase family protein [Pararcticibacter amylolyticus]PWG81944.1 GntR family transcriptional regulator [Pararcticibacter amylolyticus]
MSIHTLPFGNLIEIDRNSALPVFRQVANGLICLIRNGKIRPGYQLPPSRLMASELKLNRTTIVAAYDELSAQGWLEVTERRGVFVSKRLPGVSPRSFQADTEEEGLPGPSFYRRITERPPVSPELKPFDLMINDGYPDQRIAPLGAIFNHYKTLANRAYLHGQLMYGNAGSLSLRRELAVFLSQTRALNIQAENVLVTHGAQLAIFTAASMIIKPGSTVIVAELNYVLAGKLFEHLGARLIKVKVDEEGIDVDAVEEICKKSRPALLYVIPHHHHPTTVTLSAGRRVKLLEIIRRYQLPVIEDDYDYDFHYDNSPILPLASADHNGLVMYVGSISKTLAPTIRLGYLIGGSDFIWQASRLKQLAEIRGDVLFEESVAQLFNTGDMQRHIRRSVKIYKQRRDQFCDSLKSLGSDFARFVSPQGGMAVWVTFPEGYSLPQLSKRLAGKGIYMNEGSLYRYSPDINGARLGFASLNPDEMSKFFEGFRLSL